MKTHFFKYLLFAGATFADCQKNNNKADAYGNFEADERIVSVEASGKILALQIEEGQSLKADEVVGAIDSAQLVLKREQLQANIRLPPPT